MKLNFDEIKVIPAEMDNEVHRKGVWNVKNENPVSSRLTAQEIPYEDHCEWWKNNFDREFIYIIFYQSILVGYIRLTKENTSSKNRFEISIAFKKEYQDKGIGSYSYNLFEKSMIQNEITHIIALTHIENNAGQKFFEKNGFLKQSVENDYIKYKKDL